jgi:primosomal protein N' (replication factor Y)
MLDFPPFCRLVRIVFRSMNRELAASVAADASHLLRQNVPQGALRNVEIIGPAECPIEKINSSWRFQLLLKGPSIIPLQKMAWNLAFGYNHTQNVYIEYDVDPVSLL